MRIQRPTITQISSLKGDGAALTGSFKGTFEDSIISGAAQIAGLDAGILSGSAQIATDVSGSSTTLSSSLAGRLTTAETELGNTLVSSSAQIASDISGSFNAASESLASDIAALETYTGSLKSAISVSGANTTLLGNLTVQGTQTALDTATLNVADLNILIASGAADAASANGAGLTVDGASATLTYASTGDKWVFNKDLDLGSNNLTTSGTVDGVDISAFSSSVETRIDSKLNTSDALVNVGGFYQLTFKDQAGRINGSSELTLDGFGAGLTLTTLASLDGGIDVNGSLFTVNTSGDTKADSLGVGTAASGTTGEIRATGDITAYYSSDERLKENFKTLDGALDKVNQLNGYEFDWKDGIEDVVSKKGHDIGVKAQEVQALYPELVHERDNGYLAVDYVKLTAVLLHAVKELSAKVDELSK